MSVIGSGAFLTWNKKRERERGKRILYELDCFNQTLFNTLSSFSTQWRGEGIVIYEYFIVFPSGCLPFYVIPCFMFLIFTFISFFPSAAPALFCFVFCSFYMFSLLILYYFYHYSFILLMLWLCVCLCLCVYCVCFRPRCSYCCVFIQFILLLNNITRLLKFFFLLSSALFVRAVQQQRN